LTDSELVGQTLGRRYLVRRVIGHGGMGAVYEVEHTFTKRIGALKLLHKNVATVPEVVERFVREASAAGRIGNAHIVETIDAGELDTGEPYLFMELLEGSPVSDLIAVRDRLPFDEAVDLVIQATEGLRAAHEAGIVHRDIKPENLFVCAGATPFVKILDFGISKFARSDVGDHRLTREGSAMGTPYYMSPEQVVGHRNIDARTDVYSLGVVLYECVTGQTPFDADSLPALSVRIHEGKYTAASELRPDAPLGFDVLIARAMAVSPDDRFASMQAFGEALSTFKRAPATLSARAATPVRSIASRPQRARAAGPPSLQARHSLRSAGPPSLEARHSLRSAGPPSLEARHSLCSASMFGETSPSGPPDDDALAAPSFNEGPTSAEVEEPAPQPGARRGWRTPALVTAGAAAVTWLLARAIGHAGPAPEPHLTSSVPSVVSKPVTSPPPEPRVVVPSPTVTTSSEAVVPSSHPTTSTSRKKPSVPSHSAPEGSSRAKKDGLSEKNPFDEAVSPSP
jgi:serine/threonine protein kinase